MVERKRFLRRRLAFWGVCLTCGGTISILIALVMHGAYRPYQPIAAFVPVQKWPSAPPSGWPSPVVGYNSSGWCFTQAYASTGPRRTDPWMEMWSYGWPMRCLAERRRMGEQGATLYERRFRPDLGPLTFSKPAGILWRGLAVNAVVYGVCVAPLAAAMLWIAHSLRWKPGACRRCGYDLSGLPARGRCPECGT